MRQGGSRRVVKLLALMVLIAVFFSYPQVLDESKEIFRLVRSEVHLALFQLQSDGNIDPITLPFLEMPANQGLIHIAHATGQVNGMPANDSLDGFNASFEKGCRFIETDFEWTSDHHLVSIHDWGSFFGDPLVGVPDLEAYIKRRRSDGFRQMTFVDVDEWLLNHPSAVLVTDVKSNNPEALGLLRAAKSYHQIIPQVYSFMEYLQARKLGFRRIILTTYKTYYSNSSLRRFAEIARPSAVTVPVFRLTPELINTMAEFDIPVFTHPVPLRSDFEKLPKGVKGIYSSTLCE